MFFKIPGNIKVPGKVPVVQKRLKMLVRAKVCEAVLQCVTLSGALSFCLPLVHFGSFCDLLSTNVLDCA